MNELALFTILLRVDPPDGIVIFMSEDVDEFFHMEDI
jgi:hypothetical protein